MFKNIEQGVEVLKKKLKRLKEHDDFCLKYPIVKDPFVPRVNNQWLDGLLSEIHGMVQALGITDEEFQKLKKEDKIG